MRWIFLSLSAFALLLPSADGASAQERIEVPLASWLASRPASLPGSLETLAVTPTQYERFRRVVRDLGRNGVALPEDLEALGYELITLSASGQTVSILQESSGKGLGPTVVLNSRPFRDLIAEAPHASLEQGTREQAASLVNKAGARAAIVAGAHRCASRTATSCSGTTEVCGERGPYPDSDVAHNPRTLFHAAHVALNEIYPKAVTISLHGMRENGEAWFLLSTGARDSDHTDDSPVVRLRRALRSEFGKSNRIASCNHPEDEPLYSRKLCGFTNVQARAEHGSEDICNDSADEQRGDFIHLEQTWEVLGDFRYRWPDLPQESPAAAFLRSILVSTPVVTTKKGSQQE